MRFPPISIGLTCSTDTAGWGKYLHHDDWWYHWSSFYHIGSCRYAEVTLVIAGIYKQY